MFLKMALTASIWRIGPHLLKKISTAYQQEYPFSPGLDSSDQKTRHTTLTL
jgi:hypothetical protein